MPVPLDQSQDKERCHCTGAAVTETPSPLEGAAVTESAKHVIVPSLACPAKRFSSPGAHSYGVL